MVGPTAGGVSSPIARSLNLISTTPSMMDAVQDEAVLGVLDTAQPTRGRGDG